MISHADVEKLRSMQAAGPVVLSLYLSVPLDPAGTRELAADAGDLMAGVGLSGPDGVSTAGISDIDRDAVLATLAARGRDWLGHTVAFFACAEIGLFEVLPLPCVLPERVVLATGRMSGRCWRRCRPWCGRISPAVSPPTRTP